MSITSPPQLPASPEALFRYQVVSLVLAYMAGGEVRAHAVRAAASPRWLRPDGTLRQVSMRSVYRWLKAWNAHHIAGLEPRPRQRIQTTEALSERFVDFLRREHQRDPEASIPEIIRRARQVGVVGPEAPIDRVTVWRAARRMDLDFRHRKKSRGRDARRFRFPHRMQLVLADGKHFRAGAGRLRRVVLFFLDNATRYGLNAVVGPSETCALFLRGLYQAVRRHGLMDIVYLDKGSGFTAHDTRAVVQQLDARLIFGETRYPQGHGAVERFNRTAKAQLLRGWDDNPAIDPACAALELRAKHFLAAVYNHTPHATLGDQTPHQRWQTDPRSLRFPTDDDALRSKFLVAGTRKVSNDHILSHDGVDYEVPRGHAGTPIRFWRQVLDDRLYVLHDGAAVRILPADLAANATAGRAPRSDAPEETAPATVPSAADLAYQRDFGCVTGPDGGFPNTESS